MFKVYSLLSKLIKVSKCNYLACSLPVHQRLFYSSFNWKNLLAFPSRREGGSRKFPVVVLGSVLTIALCECQNLHDKCSKCGKCKKPCTTQSIDDSKSCILCSCEQKPITWEKQDLTHDFLLRQANIVTVDAVTRIISETVSAIADYHEKYRGLLEKLMELMEDSRTASESRQELLACQMIVVRSSVEDMKNRIIEVECYLESVTRLANAAAETAFLAIAEYASVSLMERLNSALTQAKDIKEKTHELERAANELHSLIIINSNNYSCS